MYSADVSILNASFFLGSVLGTFLPDIDHHNSILGRWFWFKQSRVHRKFTHSIMFCILAGLVGWIFLDFSFGIGVILCSLLHLMGDSITGRLPYLWYPYLRR
ncbi:MAG TPA: metal-dependent hydrolase [Acholeplasmataceae bacterium]|nr:metal-dependent hydrolase [Acholeplasmataceae bacterium]